MTPEPPRPTLHRIVIPIAATYLTVSVLVYALTAGNDYGQPYVRLYIVAMFSSLTSLLTALAVLVRELSAMRRELWLHHTYLTHLMVSPHNNAERECYDDDEGGGLVLN